MTQEALDELYRDFRKVLDSMTDEDMENFWNEMGDYEVFGPTIDELFNCDVAYSFTSAFETDNGSNNDSVNCMNGCDYSAAA